MATSLTSDSVHDFPCTSCAEEDINKEAIVLCVTCSQYLCNSCLKVHNRMAGGKQHQFVDQKDFTQAVVRTSNPDVPTEMCTKHHGILVDMFCEDHDEIGCRVCVGIDHRSCKKVSYIPDIANSRVTDHDVQTARQDVSQQLGSVKTLRNDRQKHKSRLSNEKDDALNAVTKRGKAIDSYLKKQEGTIRQRISDTYEDHRRNLDADINGCDDMIQELEKMESKLQDDLQIKNAPQTFVNIKSAGRTIRETEMKHTSFKENRNNQTRISFKVGNAVSDILVPETIFGSFEAGYRGVPTALSHTENIYIRHKTDKSVCDCNDICQLPDGTIILTDRDNSNVKSLRPDTPYTLTSTLPMSGRPFGVCVVGQSEVAVTTPHDHTVSFVSTDNKLAVKRSFKVTGQCWGIIQVNGHLYILDNTNRNIKVYDLQGKCLNTLSTDKDGSALFDVPLQLRLLPGKQQISVTDGSKGIVVMDMSGNLVSRYIYPTRQCTLGLCFDDDGNLLISEANSRKIIAMGPHGHTTVLTTMDKPPRTVYFEHKSRKVYITMAASDNIQVFSLIY